jgi:O-antigen ligase
MDRMTASPTAPGRTGLGRLLAWVGILGLAMWLVLVGGTWLGIYTPSLRLTTVALGGIALATWIVVAARWPEWRPRSVLLPAIAAALLSLALSTLTSRYPRQSVEYLGYAILLAACYLLLVRILAVPFFRARVGTLGVAFTMVIGGAYLAINVSRWVAWWDVVGRVTVPPLRPASESLTYGNPSAVLTIVLLFWCSAAAQLGLATAGRRVAVAVLGLVAAFAIVVSGSRSGWFAVGIAVLATGGLWLLGTERRAAAMAVVRQWLARTAGRIAAAVAGLAAVGALVALGPALATRLTLADADLRFNYLLAAWRMFAEAPILGTGPGTWVVQRIRYTYPPETDYYIPHAHDIYAQTLAELGIVGALAGLLLLAGLAWLVRDAIRDPDPVRRRWGWAAAFAMIYFGAHQLLDFYANMPAILVAAVLPVAWLDATATRRPLPTLRAWPTSLGRAPAVASVALAVVATAGMLATEIPALRENTAVDLANKGDWAAADVAARDAVAMDPDWAPYQMTMGLAAARVGDAARAAGAFRAAAEASDLPEAWLDLAAEEAILRNDAAARDALSRAARLGLQRPAIAMAVGELASRLGMAELEHQAYVAAIAALPVLAADSWWQADTARAAAYPGIVEEAIATADPTVGWQLAMFAGDMGRARSLAAAAAAPGVALPDDIIAAWNGDEAALERVLATCDAHPLDAGCVSWAVTLEARRGDIADQNRYLRWGFTTGGGGGIVEVSDHDMVGRTIAGEVAIFWGTYTYRRFTPWNLLVPSVVQLAGR